MAEPLSRERIIERARSMIEHEGLDAVSLRRLAADMGVTAPALYAYVNDKRDLLRAVAEDQFDELGRRVEAIDDADPLGRVRSTARLYVDFATERPELFKTMILFPPELAIGSATGQELPAATKTFEAATRAIDECIADGQFKPVDPLMAALTVWTAAHGVANVLLLGFHFDGDTEEQLTTMVIETMIDGLRA